MKREGEDVEFVTVLLAGFLRERVKPGTLPWEGVKDRRAGQSGETHSEGLVL